MWQVKIKRKIDRKTVALPVNIRALFAELLEDLKNNGPEQPEWPNYSKLGGNKYHCHLNYRYVACWTLDDEKNLILEVYYVGSRESAPY